MTSPNTLQYPPDSTLAKYGLSRDEWLRILRRQGNVCAICRRPEFLNIDHDHETGKVRGLLCSSCNYALGCLQDDEQRALEALIYLMCPPARCNYASHNRHFFEFFLRLTKHFNEGIERNPELKARTEELLASIP